MDPLEIARYGVWRQNEKCRRQSEVADGPGMGLSSGTCHEWCKMVMTRININTTAVQRVVRGGDGCEGERDGEGDGVQGGEGGGEEAGV